MVRLEVVSLGTPGGRLKKWKSGQFLLASYNAKLKSSKFEQQDGRLLYLIICIQAFLVFNEQAKLLRHFYTHILQN